MSFETLLDQPFGTIPELIAAHAVRAPAQAALIQDERRLDYAQLDRLMDRAAAALQRTAIEPGQVIAIVAGTCIEYALVFLGALRAGVTVAPLAPSASPESLAAMLSDCDARLVFVDRDAAQTLSTAAPELPRVTLDGSESGQPFDAWLAAEGARPAPVASGPEDAFNVIYSSGTTGAPKGIVQPNRMRWAHLKRGTEIGYGPGAITLISTPLYSNTTLVSFFPGVALGGTVVLMAKFEAAQFLSLAERHRVTHAMLVPVQYQRIMDLPEFARFDLSSFQLKFCTSAPFSAQLKARVLAHWPGGLVEYYGMTEGGGTCALIAHEFPDKLHTVGRPAPLHDIRLVDDDGNEVAPGELGEVVGASPAANMLGYHNQPDKTVAATWVDPSGKHFIRTGDIGRFDADGFLILVDRKKDMIISGGFNVYPSDLEAVLRQHPAVRDAAVVGVPSEAWGETPVAFVVSAPDSAESGEQIRAWANQRLGKTQRLSQLELLQVLPRNAIGKVLKRELREQYLQALAKP